MPSGSHQGSPTDPFQPAVLSLAELSPHPLTHTGVRTPLSAIRATTASLARPFWGGAVTLIFRASPSQPTTSSRVERGTTLILRRADGVGAFVTMPDDPVRVRF